MLVYFGGWFDVGVGFVGLFFDEETSKVYTYLTIRTLFNYTKPKWSDP